MANQVPIQGAITAANGRSTNLLDDPTFFVIHDVLQLGWSLVELKSRIKTVACNLTLDALPFFPNSDPTTGGRFNASLNKMSLDLNEALLKPQPDIIKATLINIVL